MGYDPCLSFFYQPNEKGPMRDYIEKIKIHIEKHKMVYSCAATAVGVAGITAVIMRGRYETLAIGGVYGSKTADTSITMRPFSFFSQQKNVVKVIARDGRGHPGYIIRSLDTQELFGSQREAASVFGISETLLSKHLSGKIQNAEGYRFERLSMAA